jgi:hypothetical protein
LRTVKDSNPIQLAEYTASNQLADEAAFCWWASFMLRKQYRIISSIKAHAKKKQQKFPKTVQRALEIDKETGTDLWKKAISKEMQHVMCAFHILEEDSPVPKMYKRTPCYMIFDIKMGFERKACFMAGGHVMDPPSNITYSSVVGQDIIHLAFLIADLNNLDHLGGKIGNAYLQA